VLTTSDVKVGTDPGDADSDTFMRRCALLNYFPLITESSASGLSFYRNTAPSYSPYCLAVIFTLAYMKDVLATELTSGIGHERVDRRGSGSDPTPSALPAFEGRAVPLHLLD
jgi:hypothetical protein